MSMMGLAGRVRPDPRESWMIWQWDLRSGSKRKWDLAQLKKSKESCGFCLVLWMICRKRGGFSLGRLRFWRSGTQLRLCKRIEEIWEAT